MESKTRNIPTATKAAFGPLKEAKNLRVNGSASIEELKEFLGSLKGKNPQEVIGLVSSSMLLQSLAVATVATLLFFVIFTVGPYFAYGPLKKNELGAKPGAAQQKASEATPSKSDGASEPATTAAEKSSSPDAGKAAEALGITDVKEADPTKNPLDKGPNIDNLLDGVD